MKSNVKLLATFLSLGLLAAAMGYADHNQNQAQDMTQQQGQSQMQNHDQMSQTQQSDGYMDQSDDAEKNICYTIGENYYKCARASRYCFWDNEDGRCEPLNDMTHCGRLGQWSCNRESSCFWDFEDGRCETVH